MSEIARSSPGRREPGAAALERVVRESSVVITCGPGGVGKTTAAAMLGVGAALAGRRACVVTIDPARRLADALGLDGLGNEPTVVEGPWPGTLSAIMLDAAGTFDALVRRYAASEAQAQSILSNRLYRNLSQALSGTTEYMASEKVFELVESAQFDLVVVDTPPTSHALDFLEAPDRLLRLLDNRVFRILTSPGRAWMRALSLAAQTLLHTLSRVVGGDVIDDAIAFFRAFDGMEEGFRRRAEATRTLLRDPASAFVLVSSPRAEPVAEALRFAARLRDLGATVRIVIANRVHPDPRSRVTDSVLGALPGPATPAPEATVAPTDDPAAGLERVRRARRDLVRTVEDEQTEAERLRRALGAPAAVTIPLLPADVTDTLGLRTLWGLATGEADEASTSRDPEVPGRS